MIFDEEMSDSGCSKQLEHCTFIGQADRQMKSRRPLNTKEMRREVNGWQAIQCIQCYRVTMDDEGKTQPSRLCTTRIEGNPSMRKARCEKATSNEELFKATLFLIVTLPTMTLLFF